MTFGLTPQGFKQKRLSDVVIDEENAFTAQFGDINIEPQSVFGQIIGVISKSYADLWENLSAVYASQYPNSAFGVSLDNVVALNGLTRLPAKQTQVFASCFGNEGTLIPANALAQIEDTNDIFACFQDSVISISNSDFIDVSVGTVTNQIYTVLLNATPYIYSLPTITFTGSFVSGNQTIVSINGVQLAEVPFTTDTNTTVAAIATQIETDPAVGSAIASGSVINITPASGFSVTIDFVSITGGVSQPTSAITFRTPANANAISSALVSVLNVGSPSWTATNNSGKFTILTNNEEQPFSAAVGSNLTITNFSSPIQFNSQDFGPIACPANSLTQIVTPIGGWSSINNLNPGITGRNVETDAELRIRRQNSIRLLGLSTVESIRANLLNDGADAVTVIENTSLNETDIVITFSGVISSGQTINVTYNVGSTITQAFDTNQNTTMTDLANQFLALPGVISAVLSGPSNTVLTIGLGVFTFLSIDQDGVDVTGSGTLPTAVVTGGQPPKSIQVVVDGLTNLQVGQEIWRCKPAGIQTYGNTSQVIVDSQGNNQTIFFSRPIQIYIWVTVSLTLYSGETFPTNGTQLVAEQIVEYGNSLGVGFQVIIQRIQAQCFQIPGIDSATIQLAATLSPTDTPSFGTSDIPIDSIQISNFDLQRVAVSVS